MTPSIKFYPVNEKVAVCRKSVSELLKGDREILNYVIVFNEDSDNEFFIGASSASPIQSFDYDSVDDFCSFVKFEDANTKIQPPYKIGTRMFLMIRRPPGATFFEIAVKVNSSRSGVYAMTTRPGNDYLTIHCHNTQLLISGCILTLNLTEYLMLMTETQNNRCCACYHSIATVQNSHCQHLVYCNTCKPDIIQMFRHIIRSTFNAHSLGFRSVRLVATAKTAATNEDIERVLTAIDQLESLPKHVKGSDERFTPITRELSDVVPLMNQSELHKTLDLLAARRHRNIDVMRLITQKMMELDANPSPSMLIRTTVNLKILSFYYPPLYDFIASKFIYRINEFSRWSQIASIVDAFAGMQINNRGFWKLICSWMDTHTNNIRPDELNSVQRIVSGCAVVNVPSKLLRRPVQKVNQRLIESVATKRKATEWLNLVHSLAIVSSLTSEANRVFLPGFFNELRQTLSLPALFRSAVHILQISSAFRHDLKQEPKLPSEIISFLKENESLTEKFRYRNNVHMQSDLEVFRQTLYLIADVNTHATSPHLDMNTGAFVDAMLWIDPKRKVVLPLSEGQNNPDAQQVAVIYGTQNLMTRKDVGAPDNFDLPPTRPLGEIQMNLRHLHARNIRPVFISCHELQSLESNEHKLPFIRDCIWSSDRYAEENWI